MNQEYEYKQWHHCFTCNKEYDEIGGRVHESLGHKTEVYKTIVKEERRHDDTSIQKFSIGSSNEARRSGEVENKKTNEKEERIEKNSEFSKKAEKGLRGDFKDGWLETYEDAQED